MDRFIKSKYWHIENIKNFGTREKAAIGMTQNYELTVIPFVNDNKLDNFCKIYHLPNNYINSPNLKWKLSLFDEIIKWDNLIELN